jgi:hypothetical protein
MDSDFGDGTALCGPLSPSNQRRKKNRRKIFFRARTLASMGREEFPSHRGTTVEWEVELAVRGSW